MRFFNIFNEEHLHRESMKDGSGFGILRLLASSNHWSWSDMASLFCMDPMMRTISLAHYHSQKHKRRVSSIIRQFNYWNDQEEQEISFYNTETWNPRRIPKHIDI
jgi:hypothetical protein